MLAAWSTNYSYAQQSGTDSTMSKHKIALKLRNPASDLVNIQLQNNLQFEVGSKDVFENVAQVQPIIPIVLNPGLRIISRVTMQLIYQRNSAKEMGKFGVSDLTVNLLLAPNFVEDDWVFGAGPVFNFP